MHSMAPITFVGPFAHVLSLHVRRKVGEVEDELLAWRLFGLAKMLGSRVLDFVLFLLDVFPSVPEVPRSPEQGVRLFVSHHDSLVVFLDGDCDLDTGCRSTSSCGIASPESGRSVVLMLPRLSCVHGWR